jgi:hypothetical protein
MPAAAHLRLAEFAVALSLASDLGLGHPLEMVLASCSLSLRLGELLGLSDDELREVYYLALFRHAGCTADAPRAAGYFGDDLAISPGFLANVDPTKPWTMLRFIRKSRLRSYQTCQRSAADEDCRNRPEGLRVLGTVFLNAIASDNEVLPLLNEEIASSARSRYAPNCTGLLDQRLLATTC